MDCNENDSKCPEQSQAVGEQNGVREPVPSVEKVKNHKKKTDALFADFDKQSNSFQTAVKEAFTKDSASEKMLGIDYHIQKRTSQHRSRKVSVSVSNLRICNYPDCTKELSTEYTMSFHCPQCNGWYCGEHAGDSAMWLLLKNPSSEPEIRIPTRVCQRCFHDKFFPLIDLDHPPNFQNITEIFEHYQRRSLEERMREVNVITTRLRKFMDYSPNDAIPFRMFERMVVEWRKDEEVTRCHTCRTSFTSLNRRHHCRLCGEIVCAEEDCSHQIHLDKSQKQLRVCAECSLSLSFVQKAKRDSSFFSAEFRKLNSECIQVRGQLADILPRFREQLDQIHYEIYIRPEYQEQRLMDARHEAMAARDTVILLFKHYDGVLKKLKDLPTSHGNHPDSHIGQICENIYMAGRRYLQQNMLPLKLLPKLDLERIRRGRLLAGHQGEQSTEHRLDKSSSLSKFLSSVLSPDAPPPIPLPANWEALSDKLEVLKEQKGQLEEFIVQAAKDQRFEDLRSLRSSLDEINREVHRLNKVFASLDLS